MIKVLKSKSLETQLGLCGFEVSLVDTVSRDVTFERLSELDGLFESIKIKFVGKRSERAGVWIGVAVVPAWLITKGLIELELMLETADDLERGVADVEAEDSLRRFERRLAEAGPARVADLVRRRGSAILERTEKVRSISESYAAEIQKLVTASSPSGAVAEVRALLGPSMSVHVTRLANCITADSGARGIYELAACALIIFGVAIEKRDFSTADSVETEVRWRMSLITYALWKSFGYHRVSAVN